MICICLARLGLHQIAQAIPMIYKVVLRESDEGYSVNCPGLPGCRSQGATEEEALENIRDAIQEYLAAVAELVRGEEVREVEVSA